VTRRAFATLACAALAACAPVPPAPAPDPAPRGARPTPSDTATRQGAIARQAELARAAREAGDLVGALEHYRVLALLDPGNAGYRDETKALEAQIREAVGERLRAAAVARRSGDVARAREGYLRVLVLDPDNDEAEKALREIEQQAMARTQADRAARARSMEEVVASARTRAAAENGADLEQRLELVRSSDASIALREARAWAEANPNDRAGRVRLAAALAERARDLESKQQREWALALYDQAATLGGSAQAESAKKAAALRRTLADEAYAEGMRLRSTDLAAAIRAWETALRIDPNHPRARDRLREAKAAQQKLERITK
jgi:hypothetical protein